MVCVHNPAISVEATIRQGYAALSEKDVEGWLASLTEDAVVHELPNLADTASYRGRDEIRGWAATRLEMVDQWEWDPLEITEVDANVRLVHVALTVRGPHSDFAVRQDVFHILGIEDERVSSVEGYLDRPDAEAALARR